MDLEKDFWMISYKLDMYILVFLYFMVDGVSEIIEFLVFVFDVEELCWFFNDEGKLFYVEVCFDDSIIMMIDGVLGYLFVFVFVYVYVKDVDVIYEWVLVVGVESV